MALPHSPYAGLTTPFMSFLDDTNAALGQIGIIQCTAAGTNLITLTPVTNMPTISAYVNLQKFSFTAANSSTGAVTLQVGSLAALPLYLADGTTQAASGAIVSGNLYEVTFLSAVNAGSGGFVVVSASSTGVAAGTYNAPNLTIDASGRVTVAVPSVSARSYLAGYILSNDSASPSRSLVISAGQCADSANTTTITQTSGFAKSINGTWVAGNGNNGLGTAVTLSSSTWYHAMAINVSGSGASDVYFDPSVTAANKPATATAFRRLGSFLTNNASTSGQISITAFNQNGDEFIWSASPNDVNVSTLGTSRTLFALSVPLGVKVNALFRASTSNATATGVMLTSPDETDQAPSATGAGVDLGMQSTGILVSGRFNVRTNTSSQIGARSGLTSTTFDVSTYGWVDTRGRFN